MAEDGDSRKRRKSPRSPASPSRGRGRSRRRSSSTSPASSAGPKRSQSGDGEERGKQSEKKSSSREASPEKEKEKGGPSQDTSWEPVPGSDRRRSQERSEAPRSTVKLTERVQAKVYWGFVTEEELVRCRESDGFHCPSWGQQGCRSKKRFGDPNALVQHLQSKHSLDWKDAVRVARTTFGLPEKMKDERKPAEPAAPPTRTATKSAARKRPKEETGRVAKTEPEGEDLPPLPPPTQPPAEPAAASSSSALPAELALLRGLFDSVAGRVLGPERKS